MIQKNRPGLAMMKIVVRHQLNVGRDREGVNLMLTVGEETWFVQVALLGAGPNLTQLPGKNAATLKVL